MTQELIGKDNTHTVPSGGGLLTVEKQQEHMAYRYTPRERLEPVAEDWHALMNYLSSNNKLIILLTWCCHNRMCGRICSKSAPRILAPHPAGIRCRGDLRDDYSPGWKFYHWEQKVIAIILHLEHL